ncbi:MAG: MarR family winged helix-turn-helix transcriptional regulator [Parvularculaceae bacterium]
MASFTLKNSPGHLLRRAQQYAHDLYAKEVGASGPTPRQFEVLHTVSKNEGLSQTDLVRATGIDRSTLADMIARMIKKGLLSRKRTKADARANAVSITSAGKRMLSSAMPRVAKAERAALAVLPKTQQSGFIRGLSAYAAALDKLENAASTPKKRAARKTTKRKTAKKKRTAKRKTTAKKRTTRRPAKRKAKRRTKRR